MRKSRLDESRVVRYFFPFQCYENTLRKCAQHRWQLFVLQTIHFVSSANKLSDNLSANYDSQL